MENLSINIHRETDVLGLARAEKKQEYWKKVVNGVLPLPGGCNQGYAKERLEYWLLQAEKYRKRIEMHITEFRKIKDPLGFLMWIQGVIETIKSAINFITK